MCGLRHGRGAFSPWFHQRAPPPLLSCRVPSEPVRTLHILRGKVMMQRRLDMTSAGRAMACTTSFALAATRLLFAIVQLTRHLQCSRSRTGLLRLLLSHGPLFSRWARTGLEELMSFSTQVHDYAGSASSERQIESSVLLHRTCPQNICMIRQLQVNAPLLPFH